MADPTDKTAATDSAKFSRESSWVCSSPYFYRTLPITDPVDPDAIIAFRAHLRAEHNQLRQAVAKVTSVDDLADDDRALYERALRALKDYELGHEGTERLVGREAVSDVSPKAVDAQKLSDRDSKLLAAAMIEAKLQGNDKAVEVLGDLAKTPGAIPEILRAARAKGTQHDTQS